MCITCSTESEGEYRCAARNTATRATADSQTLIVTVQWYPAPPTHNCPSWIVPGQTVSCTCQTSDRGNPEGTVHWISPGGQTIASFGSSSVQLNLTSIPRSNKGLTYICMANNSLPSSNTDITYVLEIAYFDSPRLEFDKDDVEGNTLVTVTCTVESNPSARMTVENIGSEAKPASGTTNNLTFTTKTQCQHNRFRCTAENNRINTQASTVRQLNVACLPRHDTSKQTDSMVTGQLQTTVSLVANVIASPVPNFTWFHYQGMTPGPVVVGTGRNVVLTEGLQSVLRVYIQREEDYGIYHVVVRNRVGSTSLFFSLTKDVSPLEASCNTLPVAAGMGAVNVILIGSIVVILYRRRLCQGTDLPERNINDGETTMGIQRDAVTEEVCVTWNIKPINYNLVKHIFFVLFHQ
ncbi:hemicentin-2-like [Haliotis rubra]|uniref:hemicentin-2-like n=1 Tax=Haliotis rubra TaxID=36100 RepID=UPI001EE4F22C|nr:hemicentin-2-like [Haliotis rubra]